MAIRPKEIGYSKEASLLYEILKKLDQLVKVTAANKPVTTTTTAP